MAEALRTALEMSRAERLCRWTAMMHEVESNDVHWWQQRFLASLAAVRERSRPHAPVAA